MTRGKSAGLSGAVRAVISSKPLAEFDAVEAFSRISPDGQGFILEGRSVEHGADRYAYVGAGNCERLFTGPGTESGDVDPAVALRERLSRLGRVDSQCVSPFSSGAVGYFAYEAVRHFEPSVGDLPPDPLSLPQSAFFLPDQLVVYDRVEQVLSAIVLVRDDAGEPDARIAADELLEVASGGRIADSSMLRPGRLEDPLELLPAASDMRHQHEDRIRRAKSEIERGELIQTVLSQRVVRRTDASPVEIYRAISALNPSPYMFMLNFGDFAIVGSSPELMVRSRGDEVSMHPIAGTRPRGRTAEEDAALEADMLLNEKERAEHVMLVDLARNDLGRVSVAGTVSVDSLMATERYSHVMHLVSRVKGSLEPGQDGLDAFVAGFPLGTLTGAPRIRAVQLISELEAQGRGPYCGGVGWFDANGDVDTGTTIRCVVMRDGEAHVQGGGGIVFDSDPGREYLESVQKMAAQLQAIEIAEQRGVGAVGHAMETATGW
jgi:anthranilate synthase component 1